MHLRLLLLTAALFLTLSACTGGRMLLYNFSDIRDYKRFPDRPLTKSATPFRFTLHPDPHYFVHKDIRLQYTPKKGAPKLPRIDSVLEVTNTVAFLVIRRDTILYERYLDKYTDSSWVASFSMAKSYTSALVGIAIAEGKIKDIEEPMYNYLPEYKGTPLEDVRIRHLLEMTANIHHAENYYNPFAGVARLYYGRNLPKQIRNLKHSYPEGSETPAHAGHGFKYQSVCTQLLGEIVVRATGRSLTDYLNEKLWSHMGMEHPATWSIDQRRNGREKAFSSINATARDYAKFGRLYLRKGDWEGKQLIPAAWVEASTRVNAADGSAWYYGYQWWIPSREGDFAAEGHLGQFIFVHPRTETIIVRLGKNTGGMRWTIAFYDILKQLP